MSQKNETPVLIVSLLITIGLIGAGVWWFTQRSGINLSRLNQAPSPSSPSTPSTSAPLSSPNSSSSGEQSAAAEFAQVQNIPSGVFNYGGSTSWAPIRGQIDSEIQAALPNFQLRYTSPVTGTPGTASGIRMLLQNQLSFSQASRSITPEEYQEAQQRGFTLKEVPVAIEGIAIAVHPDLNVPGITLEQLKNIYTGQLTNWNQVGGPNLSITPYSRQVADGGTVEFFIENILAGQNLGSNVRFISTTTQALREVSENPGGLYYASAPEIVGQCTTKPLPLGRRPDELIAPYVEPLVPVSQCPEQRNQINETVLQNGQYPITRRLFVIVKMNGQIDEQAGEAYANLLLTNQSQNLLSRIGFVSIR